MDNQAFLTVSIGLDYFSWNYIFIVENVIISSHNGIRSFRYSHIGILHTLPTKTCRGADNRR